VKRLGKMVRLILWFFLLHGAAPGSAHALLQPDAPAPRFSLNNINGGQVQVNNLDGKQLLVLFFFDVESRPSLECLNAMDLLARQHPSELVVYGISSSPPDLIRRYVREHNLTIQVLHDTARVRDLYHARQILPVGCIIGRDFRVREYYQGGGPGFKAAMSGGIRRGLQGELQGKSRPVARPSPAATRTVPAAKKRPEKAAVSAPAETAPGASPPTADQDAPHRNIGKILNDNEW
jgi:peroxiredoxin